MPITNARHVANMAGIRLTFGATAVEYHEECRGKEGYAETCQRILGYLSKLKETSEVAEYGLLLYSLYLRVSQCVDKLHVYMAS